MEGGDSEHLIFSGTLSQRMTAESLWGFLGWFLFLVILFLSPLISYLFYKFFAIYITLLLLLIFVLSAFSLNVLYRWQEFLVPLFIISGLFLSGYIIYGIFYHDFLFYRYYESIETIIRYTNTGSVGVYLAIVSQHLIIASFVAFMLYAAGKHMQSLELSLMYVREQIAYSRDDYNKFLYNLRNRFNSSKALISLLLTPFIISIVLEILYNVFLDKRGVINNYRIRFGLVEINPKVSDALLVISGWSISVAVFYLLVIGIFVLYLAIMANRWTYIWSELDSNGKKIWYIGVKPIIREGKGFLGLIKKKFEEIIKKIYLVEELIFKTRIEPDPYHGDRLGGLRPLINTYYRGQILLAIGVGLLSPEIVAFWYPELYRGEINLGSAALILGLGVLVAIGIVLVIIFAWITYVFHRVLTEIKESELSLLYKWYSEYSRELKSLIESHRHKKSSGSSDKQTIEKVQEISTILENLESRINFVESIPRWPISLKVSLATTGSPTIVFSILTTVGRSILTTFL